MLTLIVTLRHHRTLSYKKFYVRHFEACPWERLPVAGDVIHLNAINAFADTDVLVEKVTFDLEGDARVELAESVQGYTLEGDQELIALGFQVTDDMRVKPDFIDSIHRWSN